MIITFISIACGSEQERALLLTFIVSYVVDDFSVAHCVYYDSSNDRETFYTSGP